MTADDEGPGKIPTAGPAAWESDSTPTPEQTRPGDPLVEDRPPSETGPAFPERARSPEPDAEATDTPTFEEPKPRTAVTTVVAPPPPPPLVRSADDAPSDERRDWGPPRLDVGTAERNLDSEPTEVHVHIGRIEVTAVHEPAPAKRTPRPARKPTLSLDEYLSRRGGRST